MYSTRSAHSAFCFQMVYITNTSQIKLLYNVFFCLFFLNNLSKATSFLFSDLREFKNKMSTDRSKKQQQRAKNHDQT